jgi:hypothetical protein
MQLNRVVNGFFIYERQKDRFSLCVNSSLV